MSNGDSGGLFSGTWTQVFAATTGTLFAIQDGISYGWTAPVIPYLISEKSHIKTTLHEAEWLETISMLGSMCGLPITIFFVNRIGCKRSLLLTSTVSLLSWLTVIAANRMVYLYIARFIFGICGNMAFIAGPMYVAEIANQRVRGFLSSITYLMMLVGIVLVYSVAPFTPFYVIPLISAAILITELATFSFVPESPYYYAKHERIEEARKSLQFFRPGKDVGKEMEDITNSLERQKTESGKISDMFRVRSNRKPLVIMTVLNAGQHMAGLSVILMNLHLIIDSAGSIYMSTSTVAIIFSVIMLVAANIASLQVDKYGRKALLIFSASLTAACLLAMTVYFHLKYNGYDVSGVSWIPIVSVMVYAFAFKLGLGIVPIIITAEVFSSKLKALGMTMADSTYVIGAIISIQIYQWLATAFGIHVPFYIFTISCLSVAVFTHFCIPETKGKTLEEIQILLKGKKYLQEKIAAEEETKRLEAS